MRKYALTIEYAEIHKKKKKIRFKLLLFVKIIDKNPKISKRKKICAIV